MKRMFFAGLVALMLVLLALPGAVSADADVSVSGSVVDEDLTVTAISPNVGAGAFMFANEPNVISVTVKNQGGLDAAASTVSVIVGSNTYTAAVGELAAGAEQIVTVTDPASYTAAMTVSYTATADSTGVITESNEGNNALTQAITVYNNGYKGKRYTPELGGDMTTQVTYDGRYDVVYSHGDSVYKSNKWSSATYTWTSSDLSIPSGATVVSARLYQPWGWNKMASDPAFTASFNGNTVTPIATYKDTKGFATSNYPYGVFVYDVTGQFNKAGNTLVLTPEGTPGTTNDYLLWGGYLIVTYSDSAATEKQIRINDEFDMISSSINAPTYKYSVNDAEATVYAPFTGISTSEVDNAQVIAIVAESNPSTDAGKSKFYFNSQEYTGFWADYLSTAKIGFSVFDVTAALTSGANEARLQSYDDGSGGDSFYAMNTILVIEKTESAVGITSLGASATSGDAPLSVTFTPVTTGTIVSYAWDFDNDGDTDSTAANPTFSYDTPGTYSVKLTVTGIGTGNTATKTETDYITVMEPAPVIDFTATPTSGVAPLTVAFDATNTGGEVTSWTWEYKLNGGTTWTEFATTEDASHAFTEGVYDIRLTAEGPDHSDVETKTGFITVGESSISVSVTSASIDFQTMQAGVDETGSTTVNVDVTGGTAWSVTGSASNGGYMGTGTANLASPFQLSNGGSFQAMTTNFANFMAGSAGVDGSDTADVKQAIAAADAPGAYSITLTFTGAFA